MIVASSSAVYGANPELPKRESMRAQPLSPYAVSKLATESYALAYRHCYAMDILALRFFNVYGPLQAVGHAYAAVIPAFLDRALAGRPLTIHGDGTQTRDFTYVGSVTALICRAIVERTSHHDPVNLAFGSRSSLLEVVDLLEEQLGRPLPRVHTDVRAGDVAHSQADSSTLHELFPGLKPEPLEAGLSATLAWFQSGATSRS